MASRMFGSDMKASFHSSGQCQWSATDSWVRRQAGIRNAERHVHRWRVSYPTGNEALLLFRVEIPASELRAQVPQRDKKKVWWVSGVPDGATARFLFYITRPSDIEPGSQAGTPARRHLFSLRLSNARWFVCLVELISLAVDDIKHARTTVTEQVRSAGLVPNANHRMSLFIQATEGGAHGLLELCLTEDQPVVTPDVLR